MSSIEINSDDLTLIQKAALSDPSYYDSLVRKLEYKSKAALKRMFEHGTVNSYFRFEVLRKEGISLRVSKSSQKAGDPFLEQGDLKMVWADSSKGLVKLTSFSGQLLLPNKLWSQLDDMVHEAVASDRPKYLYHHLEAEDALTVASIILAKKFKAARVDQ